MTKNDPENPDVQVDVRDLLNAQTGRIGWEELQRHFARGNLILVAAELDLIEAAARVIDDDGAQVARWLDEGRLTRPDLEHARDWEDRRPEFWGVVAAPWVLVQECADA